MTQPTTHDFSTTLADVADVEGWMTDGQARLLWDSARRVDAGGRIVEIGSFRGRSMVVLARAAAPDVELVAIDPHAGNDRGPQEIDGFVDEAAEDHDVFNANLEKAGRARSGAPRAEPSATPPTVTSTTPSTCSTSTAPTATAPPAPTSGSGAPGSPTAAPC